MNPINILRKLWRIIYYSIIEILCVPIIEVYYNGFWNYRSTLIKKNCDRTFLYNTYLDRHCASIGLKSQFKSLPILPHGLHGIHISDGAKLGKNCVIMQNVTIGSNTLTQSKMTGAPILGDNIFIGANATIIGGISVGDNCRIGSNCCVFADIPSNQTVVYGGGNRIIPHGQIIKENNFIFFKNYG